MVFVFPSLPVPEITMAKGAGLSCAESHTRNLLSNQRISGTGRRQGSSILISDNGTFAGKVAMPSGGVPNTVARSPAESARPVAGPGTARDCGSDCGSDCGASGCAAATETLKMSANGINCKQALIV